MKRGSGAGGERNRVRLIKAGYLSAEIAEWYAKGLFEKGCASVEVIDLVTGHCVKQVIPEAVPRAGP